MQHAGHNNPFGSSPLPSQRLVSDPNHDWEGIDSSIGTSNMVWLIVAAVILLPAVTCLFCSSYAVAFNPIFVILHYVGLASAPMLALCLRNPPHQAQQPRFSTRKLVIAVTKAIIILIASLSLFWQLAAQQYWSTPASVSFASLASSTAGTALVVLSTVLCHVYWTAFLWHL